MLPPHAPEIYLDRATLWNAVENCEKHPKAQLAYSFDIAMQNELTLEENMELARKFVQEQFVAKGMIADLAFHSPEKEDGGIPNPHFHVMTTMRPLNPDGTWGQKQRREYLLDEDGNRIRDKNGDYMFNAVHTTDWHEPETLEHWREQWAAAVNTKFEEKGLDGHYDEAIADYEKTMTLMPPPRFVDPAEAIAQICEIRGDYETAITYYEKVIAIEKADWHETQGEAIDAPQRSIARLREKLASR